MCLFCHLRPRFHRYDKYVLPVPLSPRIMIGTGCSLFSHILLTSLLILRFLRPNTNPDRPLFRQSFTHLIFEKSLYFIRDSTEYITSRIYFSPFKQLIDYSFTTRPHGALSRPSLLIIHKTGTSIASCSSGQRANPSVKINIAFGISGYILS